MTALEKFFSHVRESKSIFTSRRLAQKNVLAIEALFRSMERFDVFDTDYAANILSQVYRETGGYMWPIKETVYAGHKNKNPTDSTVIRRLDNAFARGQLKWVKTPYWRDGAFGRGMIQLTHWANYDKLGKRLGRPLRSKPDLLLNPDVSADVAVVGMLEGLFRPGRKLANYRRKDGRYDARGARAIVNGDGKYVGAEIAANHYAFRDAIRAAGGLEKIYHEVKITKSPPPSVDLDPLPPKPARGFVAIIMELFRALSEKFRS